MVKEVTEIYVVQGLELECPLKKEHATEKQMASGNKERECWIYAQNY
jgi:hypothetical protein